MKKFIALALALTVTGCTASSPEASNVAFDKFGTGVQSVENPFKEAKSRAQSVKTFLENAEKNGELDEIKEMGGDIMTMELEATEDTLIMKATFKEEIPGDIADLRATFEPLLQQQASTFKTQAHQIAMALGRDEVTVRVSYYSVSGEEIISQDFTSSK